MKNSSKLNQSSHPSVSQENSIDNNEIQAQALNASMASFLKLDMLSHNFEAGVNDFLNKVEDIIKDTEEDLRNKSEKEEKEEKADIVENSEIPVENATVAQTEMSVVNEGTVQPLPDSSYIGSWAQVNSTPRQLDLSNVRINLPEEYNNFYEFNAARNENNIALLPINPPTARNDSYNFSGAALPINLTLMLDISGSMRLKGLAEFSKMLTLQQTLVGETGLIYTLSQLSPEVNIWVVPTPSNSDFYTDDDNHSGDGDPQLFGAQYFDNDPHAAMAYILSLFPAYDEFYDAVMQYGLDTLGAANPMFIQGEQNMLYFIADGIPVYGPIGSGAHGADPNIINLWQTALEEYDADAVVIGIGGEDGMANALGPITNGEDPSSVLEPDAALSDFKDIVLSGTQQISGNLLNNDDANEDAGPSNPLVVTSFQQNGNVGMVGIPFITALGATLIVNADGSFIYEAPLSQLQNIGTVTESFDYTISNGYGSDTANFEIEIDGIDTPNVEFAYAVDDVVVLFDDVNEMQTFTGNVLDNDYLLGSESIIAATAHAFISGSGSIDGYFWPFENSVVYDNGATRFTLNNDGSYILEELEADGLSQMVAIMESINSSFKIAYALSGDNGADIGFLEFALASEAPQPIVNLENNARLQYVDIVNDDDDALFDNDESISSISEDVMRSSLDEAEFSSPHPENVPLDMEAPLSAFG